MTYSSPASTGLMPIQVDDHQSLMDNMLAQVPPMQFMRELPFNGIQACQRVHAATGRRGKVVIDAVDVALREGAGSVRKLRIWDTGDGMTREELVSRMNTLSSRARTGVNFGLGAKLAAAKVSPHGVIYISLRDGEAYQARLERDANGSYGLRCYNRKATSDVERVTKRYPTEKLPQELLDAGHGTVVILLGTSDDDPTEHSLKPAGRNSNRWVLEVLNERFTRIPDEVEMVAVMPLTTPRRGVAVDTRHVRGSAEYLDSYTQDQTVNPDVGARGSVKIGGAAPATANWWVLPAAQAKDGEPAKTTKRKEIPSFTRIGGNVRVVTDDEAYITEGTRYLSEAGVWNFVPRVEIQFVPDPQVGAQPDIARSTLTINGAPVPLLEWCRLFKAKMPTAIHTLIEQSSPTANSHRRWEQRLVDHDREYGAVRVRSNHGALTGVATGEMRRGLLAATGPDPMGEPDQPAPFGRRCSGAGVRPPSTGEGREARPDGASRGTDPGRLEGTSSSAGAGSATDGVVHDFETVQVGGGAATGSRRVKAARITPTLPEVRWVNENGVHDVPDLGAYAGRFITSENLLVLNAAGVSYRRILRRWQDEFSTVPGSAGYIESTVREYWESHLVDAVLGVLRDFPASERDALLTTEALSATVAASYHVSNRLKQVFSKRLRGASHTQDMDASGDSFDEFDDLGDSEEPGDAAAGQDVNPVGTLTAAA